MSIVWKSISQVMDRASLYLFLHNWQNRKKSFELFITEAEWFLSKEKDVMRQMKHAAYVI